MSWGQVEEMEVDDNQAQCFSRKGRKIFNDPVHGSMEFDPLLVKIIDTPQFQRLRNIRQLGGAYFVYPGASHNRFEHSLGVAYLAGELASSIRRKQPDLEITEKDILNVQIAGLCHDLGHGPFSHAFDMYFIPKVLGSKLKHEDLSIKMFDHLIEENGLELKEDLYFIKDLINPLDVEAEQRKAKERKSGKPEDKYPEDDYVEKIREMRTKYKGKRFLWDIISNKNNGLDVDKWDYFARDCLYLGLKNSFDHRRFVAHARVVTIDGVRHICYPDKEAGNVYDMFYIRNTLHRRAYKHRVTKIIEHMIVEALVISDEHLKIFKNAAGEKLTMSECLSDMHAYTFLTDAVLDHIMCSDNPDLEEAKEIIRKVQKRDLYKHIGKTTPITAKEKIKELREKAKNGTELCQEILDSYPAEEGSSLTAEDLVFSVMKMDYGQDSDDPVNNVYFFTKKDPTRASLFKREEVSEMLPNCFLEAYVHLYCKKSDTTSISRAKNSFETWCEKYGLTPKTGDVSRKDDRTPNVQKLKKQHQETQASKRHHEDTGNEPKKSKNVPSNLQDRF